MTAFEIGGRYTRDQVRAKLGLPAMAGGDWATGAPRLGDEVFVFCNVGIPGRTGHDYPNRWIDDALDWFGQAGSTPHQPQIAAMVSHLVTTHIFWRGRNRGPFTYAGVGRADGVWGEKPVEVLWRFKTSAEMAEPIGSGGPASENVAAHTALRHGPPPSLGLKTMLIEDGECSLYVMTLDGADALFPHLAPTASGRTIVKVGISKFPERRQRELNAGFPRGAAAGWKIRKTRAFVSVADAYVAEGGLLERLAAEGWWINGEFAIIPDACVAHLLG